MAATTFALGAERAPVAERIAERNDLARLMRDVTSTASMTSEICLACRSTTATDPTSRPTSSLTSADVSQGKDQRTHRDPEIADEQGRSAVPGGTSFAVDAELLLEPRSLLADIPNEHSHEPHWEVLTVLLVERIVRLC
jgi:hypothetical protein